MSAPSLTAVRDALAATFGSVDGLRAYTHFPEKVNAPAAIVTGPSADYDVDTMTDEYTIPVLILCAESDDRTAQLRLDGFLDAHGPTSVRAAIQADDSLGGVVHYAHCTHMRDYGIHELNAIRYIGAIIDVELVVDNTA